MSFQKCFAKRRAILFIFAILLFLVIPLNTALAQDPETTEQENSDRQLVAGAVILLVAGYTAIFVGEDADSRGKDGFQWGLAFFTVVSAGPLIYYLLAENTGDDKLITGAGIFIAALCLGLGVYYFVLQPRRFRLS